MSKYYTNPDEYSFACLWEDVREKRIERGEARDYTTPYTQEDYQELFDRGGRFDFYD